MTLAAHGQSQRKHICTDPNFDAPPPERKRQHGRLQFWLLSAARQSRRTTVRSWLRGDVPTFQKPKQQLRPSPHDTEITTGRGSSCSRDPYVWAWLRPSSADNCNGLLCTVHRLSTCSAVMYVPRWKRTFRALAQLTAVSVMINKSCFQTLPGLKITACTAQCSAGARSGNIAGRQPS